jgi:hypothetical protein
MMYKDNYDDLREALKDYEDLIKAKVSMNSWFCEYLII